MKAPPWWAQDLLFIAAVAALLWFAVWFTS
jgi:hypothetical protein